MFPFSQVPINHVGFPGQYAQNCPCEHCRTYFKLMNDNLRASCWATPQHLWNEQQIAYMRNLQRLSDNTSAEQ
jgi:hypothetical protein